MTSYFPQNKVQVPLHIVQSSPLASPTWLKRSTSNGTSVVKTVLYICPGLHSSPKGLLSPISMASATKGAAFLILFTLINLKLNLKSHRWLLATILDSTAPEPHVIIPPTLGPWNLGFHDTMNSCNSSVETYSIFCTLFASLIAWLIITSASWCDFFPIFSESLFFSPIPHKPLLMLMIALVTLCGNYQSTCPRSQETSNSLRAGTVCHSSLCS